MKGTITSILHKKKYYIKSKIKLFTLNVNVKINLEIEVQFLW